MSTSFKYDAFSKNFITVLRAMNKAYHFIVMHLQAGTAVTNWQWLHRPKHLQTNVFAAENNAYRVSMEAVASTK